MVYREEKRDLFSVPRDHALCHCISSDFKMGAGIAVKFAGLGVKSELQAYRDVCPDSFWQGHGYCICVSPSRFEWETCFNLITKELYFQKPTLQTMGEALNCMKTMLLDPCKSDYTRCRKIAMPKIGCGLDKLKWEDVSEIIKDVFSDIDVEILVCRQ